MILDHTQEHVFLIHNGARYHTSASTQGFLLAHSDRLTEYPLPSYSPDDIRLNTCEEDETAGNAQQVLQRVCSLTVSVTKHCVLPRIEEV